jgi:hypothetical protein
MHTLALPEAASSRLAFVFRALERHYGWEPEYEDPFFEHILDAGFNAATVQQAFVLAQIVEDLGPLTVRGAFYRAVSAGLFPGTDLKHYGAAQRIILKLRRCDCVSYGKIVDSTRRRLRPSSWNGISDFMETVASAYRRDFWTRQETHVEVFVEKDAMSGVLEPVTRELNVNLNVTRGFCSETMVMEIAQCWNMITKPIQVYYLGDHDPAGLDIERDLCKKLGAMCDRGFNWDRLAVTAQDFFDTDVIGFPVKKNAAKIKWEPYVNQFGDRCVEADAINPGDIRDRLKAAIESHIDLAEWERLRQIEELERQSVKQFVLAQKGGAT